MLEMFQGGVTWRSGIAAAQSLKAFIESNAEEDIPGMPDAVAEILTGCFREDPAQRWQSLEAVVQNLKGVYYAAVGVGYARSLREIDHKSASQIGSEARQTASGASWADPKEWLELALRAEGRDPAEVAEIVAREGTSRRGQLVADVASYDEARRIFERLVKGGRKDMEICLAHTCNHAAFVHETADDFSGALLLYDRAIELLVRLVDQLANVEGRHEFANDLATFYMNKASAVVRIGDNRTALGLYNRAIEIREQLVNAEGRRELANDLATLYMNKAVAVRNLGDNREAVSLYDRGIEILERLVKGDGRRELVHHLALVYMNKANATIGLGDNQAAEGLYSRAIEILERLVNDEGRRELANDLVGVYMNKAVAVRNLGDNGFIRKVGVSG
jgi:tetratricopeptide (TPR) repeat protein